MYGTLYIIKNRINGKVYIGKTYKSVKSRFREHVQAAYNEHSHQYKYKFYRAIRKYGSENFYG